MNLKKSDKIVIAAAIAVLIVAAIGIIFYTYGGEEEITPPVEGKKYEVTWVKDEGSISSITEFVKFKETYDKPFTVTVDTPGSVITDVHVRVIWEDDNIVGRFFTKGKDILTATVTAPDGESKTHTGEGEGNETLDFHINNEPVDETIENVNDSIEAQQKVREEYQGKNSVTFGVNVTVEKGKRPSILRPLKLLRFLLDKGNEFTFEITYDYYYPSIVEIENPGDNGTTLDLPQDNTGTQTWYAMGFPGKN